MAWLNSLQKLSKDLKQKLTQDVLAMKVAATYVTTLSFCEIMCWNIYSTSPLTGKEDARCETLYIAVPYTVAEDYCPSNTEVDIAV